MTNASSTPWTELVDGFDAAAPTYDAVGVDFFAPFGQALVRHADIRPGECVLDVGCGAVLLPAAEAAGPAGRVVLVGRLQFGNLLVGEVSARAATASGQWFGFMPMRPGEHGRLRGSG